LTAAETAADTIARHHMIDPGGRVLVAFSGGADSTATVLLLQALGHDVVLGHVDHGMRSDSADDAAHCARVAGSLGLPFLQARVTVDPPTQAEARRVRYEALAQMAQQCGAARIATGHTMDDQAETVLLRLERGGFGLGIPPVRGNIIRPVLDLRRSDTERVCREAGLDFCTDPSNRNLKYRRVVMRESLAAAPDTEVARLAHVADASRQEVDLVAAGVEQLWVNCVTVVADETRVKRPGLARAAHPVQHQLVRRAARRAGVELTNRLAEDILSKVLRVTGAHLALPDGISVWSEREEMVFGRFREQEALPQVTLTLSGTTVLPEWGLQLVVEEVQVPVSAYRTAGCSTEVLDASLVTGALSVRQWQPGDRFHPLGGPGTRKLQDFFVDSGVPRAARHRVPVVVSGDRIVWVAGHRLDDRFKLRPETTGALRLTVSPAAQEKVA
jgi:tRNA(Ile)-lysidine synthase